MKPVVIFRTARTEGPGYFATYLERRSIPWELVALDEGEKFRRTARVLGLAVMGGPMSANDDLPWIAPLLELCAMRCADVPVIGHCLGGQLMSRAFGGAVRLNPVREIGWGEVRVADNGVAREWLGELQAFETFQWHGETFSIPPGATRCSKEIIASTRRSRSAPLRHAMPRRDDAGARAHLGRHRRRGNAHPRKSPAVQPAAEIERDLEPRLDRLHQIADRIYDRWSEGLSRGS